MLCLVEKTCLLQESVMVGRKSWNEMDRVRQSHWPPVSLVPGAALCLFCEQTHAL